MAELAQQHPVEYAWLPFELRPEPEPLPDLSGPNLERSRANWTQRVVPLAERYGVEMRFTTVKPRSRWAHEAAEFARDSGQFDAMREAIFRAYWVDGQDIGQAEVLAAAAASVGLEPDALRTALAAGLYTARVRELEMVAAQLGVRAVPTMVFGDTVAVQGAQPYAVLRQAYEEAEQQGAKPSAT